MHASAIQGRTRTRLVCLFLFNFTKYTGISAFSSNHTVSLSTKDECLDVDNRRGDNNFIIAIKRTNSAVIDDSRMCLDVAWTFCKCTLVHAMSSPTGNSLQCDSTGHACICCCYCPDTYCNFTNVRCTIIFGTFGASVSYLNITIHRTNTNTHNPRENFYSVPKFSVHLTWPFAIIPKILST